MYESPIILMKTQTDNFIKEVNEKTEEVIFKAVVNVLPQVNKEELVKALEYDRGQYAKGYHDRDVEIIHCKDCRWYDKGENEVSTWSICTRPLGIRDSVTDADYCSFVRCREESEVE